MSVMDKHSTAFDWDPLVSLLRGLGSSPVYYYPNPGNAGDSVINCGAFKLFRKAGVEYRMLMRPSLFDAAGKCLVYGGGGGLTPDWGFVRGFLRRFHSRATRIVLLPHTICGNEDFLAELGPNVTLVCREKISYEHVLRHAPRAEAILSHDLAFLLTAEELLNTQTATLRVLARVTALKAWYILKNDERRVQLMQPRALSLYVSRLLRGGPVSDHLDAFRADCEASNVATPASVDVSAEFAFGTWDEETSWHAATRFSRFLNRYDRIRTNRLHGGIVSSILGKEVEMYANAYFKCRAVYEHSLADRYPNVKWCGSWQDDAVARSSSCSNERKGRC